MVMQVLMSNEHLHVMPASQIVMLALLEEEEDEKKEEEEKEEEVTEIDLCCSLALWLGVDVARHGSAHPQTGVHHTPNGRLLPRDAVVVIVVSEILLLPPHWLLHPSRPE